jgi:putative endonuclease
VAERNLGSAETKLSYALPCTAGSNPALTAKIQVPFRWDFYFPIMPFYVYIIYSEKFDVYYKGFSEDLDKRLEFHNTDKSKYTSGKGPWKLVYHESFDTRTEAMRREKQLKKQNRNYLLWLINGA